MNQLTDASFQGFFTNASDIRNTMVHLLGNVTDQVVLEPCFGEGAFIMNLIGTPKKIDAIDIDPRHFGENQTKVKNCDYFNIDFIDYFIRPELRKSELLNTTYDSVICNPPYGLKFSKEYRAIIKKAYPNIYARESYALFFYLAISLLKAKGRYVFIIPDSFLTSKNLSYMREFIVNEARPTHIIQFKSKRFESVNFGYSNMCIISGVKAPSHKSHETIWIDATSSDESLMALLSSENDTVFGQYFIDNVREAWISPKSLRSVELTRDFVTLNDISECKTGIYTGDNKRFCGYDAENPPKRVNGHPVDWSEVILTPTEKEKSHGVDKEIAYVPFIRGGHRSPLEITNSCIRWDVSAIKHYSQDKKARLQNKSFYFRKGLAVPMVTSGRLSASEMENSIFDQGVVGVFAKEELYHNFLLIYLNDPISSKLKALIAPGANNSANYLKRLKIPKLSISELKEAQNIVDIARTNGWDKTQALRDNFIKRVI